MKIEVEMGRHEKKRQEKLTKEKAYARYRHWRERTKESKTYIAILFAMCEGICPRCDQKMFLYFGKIEHPRLATLDHIMPISKTKMHDKMNLQIMCYECNHRKADTI